MCWAASETWYSDRLRKRRRKADDGCEDKQSTGGNGGHVCVSVYVCVCVGLISGNT